MESTEATDGGRRLDSARTVSTNITSLKNKRAAVKRRITNTLKKLESTIEQYGRKAIIRGYVNNLQEYLKVASTSFQLFNRLNFEIKEQKFWPRLQ